MYPNILHRTKLQLSWGCFERISQALRLFTTMDVECCFHVPTKPSLHVHLYWAHSTPQISEWCCHWTQFQEKPSFTEHRRLPWLILHVILRPLTWPLTTLLLRVESKRSMCNIQHLQSTRNNLGYASISQSPPLFKKTSSIISLTFHTDIHSHGHRKANADPQEVNLK